MSKRNRNQLRKSQVFGRRRRIGVVGTGFIATSLIKLLHAHNDFDVSCVLTRRNTSEVQKFGFPIRVTNSVYELMDSCEVLVECSGDVLHATEVIQVAALYGRHVVTMNSEFHVTCGSYFVDKVYLTEAEGDQPGSTAALRKETIAMGFQPLVYGNMKGFLNLCPSDEDMTYWSRRQGISKAMTTSFTDGTKVQIEQALVANMFGADIARPGMMGLEHDNFRSAALELGDIAAARKGAISDFVISASSDPGVFIIASHDEEHQPALKYLKLGDGPHYLLVKPYHLCAFEIPKTLQSVFSGERPLLNNSSSPTIGVGAIAKKRISRGQRFERGIGSSLLRGETIRIAEQPNHVPIGIMQGATAVRTIEPGQMIQADDVELPDSLACNIALGKMSLKNVG